MAVRVPDIAKVVGLSVPSIYQILANPEHPRYTPETRQRVLKAAKELGYRPMAAAKALSTRRTGQIGFILSDRYSAGWSDPYYGTMLQGVEQACRERGYGVMVSRYNLSNLDTFVFPEKIGQRSVDGVVLAGYLGAAVVARFSEFGLPCFTIGDNHEVARLVPSFAIDSVTGSCEKIRYAASLGHRRFRAYLNIKPRQQQIVDQVVEKLHLDPELRDLSISLCHVEDETDPQWAQILLRDWREFPAAERPTCLLGTDRILVHFLGLLSKHGYQCPRDVSVMAYADSLLCESCRPALAATYFDIAGLGKMVANLLVDHLENGKEPDPNISRADFPCRFVCRESVGPVPGK